MGGGLTHLRLILTGEKKIQSGKREHTLNKANVLYEITGSNKMSLKDARSEENI